MRRSLQTRWPVVAALSALLCLAFLLGHSRQLVPAKSHQGGGLFKRGGARELKDALESGRACLQGPLVTAAKGGRAKFSTPSEGERLFTATPKDDKSSTPAEQQCSVVSVLSIVRDGSSWGEGGRSFVDFLNVLRAVSNEGVTLDLALSVESEEEFHNIVCAVIKLYRLDTPPDSKCQPVFSLTTSAEPVPLSGIQVFHIPMLRGDPHPAVLDGVPREQRGTHSAQKARRRWLARNRNRLSWGAAKDQAAYLWLDTDIERLPEGMLAAMLDSEKDVIVPVVRCTCSFGTDYFDKNTWIGPIQPGFSEAERQLFRSTDEAWPGFKALHEWNGRWGPGLHYLDNGKYKDETLVPVDSVGGAVLFVRPWVFQQGANFGIANMVGTDWENEGWDSIETEALCWMANKAGFSCWGMPQQIAWHVPCKY